MRPTGFLLAIAAAILLAVNEDKPLTHRFSRFLYFLALLLFLVWVLAELTIWHST